jgi:chaperonin GroEL
MANRTFLTGEKAKELVYEGVRKLNEAVSITLGPGGRHVAIHKGGVTHVTKDGVTVANSLTLMDQGENIGANIIKNVTNKMSYDAGDGTTTATLLASALIHRILKALKHEANPIHVKDGMDKSLEFITKYIKENSVQITNEDGMLEVVATVSANHDEHIGKLIAEAIKTVGSDGIVDVERGTEAITKLETRNGMTIERGYFSPYFITNPSTGKAELIKPIILLYAGKMDRLNELLPILETIKIMKRPLVIIAEDFDTMVSNTMILNKLQNGLQIALIQAPGFARTKMEALEDIAAFIDGTVIGNEKGVSLTDIKQGMIEKLGEVDKIVIDDKETVFIKEKKNETRITERVSHIREILEKENVETQKSMLRKRLSKMNGYAVTIKVGGNSEMEIFELGDRIDDALNAAKSAIKEGVVPGGGMILYRCKKELDRHIREVYGTDNSSNSDMLQGMEIVSSVLDAPLEQILKNAGENMAVQDNYLKKYTDIKYGYDAKNKVLGDMFEMKIIDPAKVVRLAIESAVSVAKIYLTLDCIIIDDVTNPKQK